MADSSPHSGAHRTFARPNQAPMNSYVLRDCSYPLWVSQYQPYYHPSFDWMYGCSTHPSAGVLASQVTESKAEIHPDRDREKCIVVGHSLGRNCLWDYMAGTTGNASVFGVVHEEATELIRQPNLDAEVMDDSASTKSKLT